MIAGAGRLGAKCAAQASRRVGRMRVAAKQSACLPGSARQAVLDARPIAAQVLLLAAHSQVSTASCT
jgi:hypothetical protein